MLVSSLMDHNERFMAAYQHCNSISLLKSDTESESENEAVKDIPDYLKNNKEECHKQHHLNIKAFLELYLAEKHTPKDYKLLKGAFTSKRLQNDELKTLEVETDLHSKLSSRSDSDKNIKKDAKMNNSTENEEQWIDHDKSVHESIEDMSCM